MTDARLCQIMLLLNALWDFISFVTIVYSFGFNFEEGNEEDQSLRNRMCQCIAEMHTSLWVKTEDYASKMLMACLTLLHCVIRLFAGLDSKFIILAAASYGIEGLFFLMESLKGTMDTKKAFAVSVFSFVCMMICIANIT